MEKENDYFTFPPTAESIRQNTRERMFFSDYVESMQKFRLPVHYYNRFPWQAREVVSHIITYAQNKRRRLRVFLGDLWSFYGDEIAQKVKQLTDSGIGVDMILAEIPQGGEMQRWTALFSKNKKINIRAMPKYDENLCHFWLVGKAYRFEIKHPKYYGKVTDKFPERPARFSFNSDEARRILDYWNSICERKELVPIFSSLIK